MDIGENKYHQAGFTLIEMIVVITILGLVLSFGIANFAAQQAPRNLVIVQNEMVTNFRKAQSYTLSSRNSTDNKPIKFYVVNIGPVGKSQRSYEIGSVDSTYGYQQTEIVTIPQPAYIDEVTIGTYSDIFRASGEASLGCIQVIFGAPFGKVYIRTSSCTNWSTGMLADLKDPVKLDKLSNKALQLIMYDGRNALSYKTVVIKGLSGNILAE